MLQVQWPETCIISLKIIQTRVQNDNTVPSYNRNVHCFFWKTTKPDDYNFSGGPYICSLPIDISNPSTTSLVNGYLMSATINENFKSSLLCHLASETFHSSHCSER